MTSRVGYLDFDRLEALDPIAYRESRPFPHLNPAGLLYPEAFGQLQRTLPNVALFERQFGRPRKYGQRPHDRHVLEYVPGVPLSPDWLGFIQELRSARYKRLLRRLTGSGALEFRFHWHYTPTGCAVSPHCDAPRKIGSHIFYFNTPEEWREEWGGGTLLLDDGGRLDPKSAPEFEDFDHGVLSAMLGNRSLLFTRQGNSWHGVPEIRCPEGRLRKAFIVVINRSSLRIRVRDAWKGKRIQRF